MKLIPTRIDQELYLSAKLVADTQSRTAAEQIAHWARIGRELESSRSLSPDAIRAVLAGATRYDEPSPEEQALLRARWLEIGDALRAELDMRRELAERSAVEPSEGVEGLQPVRRRG